jgi:Tfp pilus assembly pilus retraction ATPase PilT
LRLGFAVWFLCANGFSAGESASTFGGISAPGDMSYELPELIQLIVAEGGEAVHLHDGEAPVLEIRGQLYRIEGPCFEPGDTQTLLRSIAPSDEFQEVMRNGISAFEHRHGEATFFRILAFREDGSLRLELRRIL